MIRNIQEERVITGLEREKTELSREISSLKASINDEDRRIDLNKI